MKRHSFTTTVLRMSTGLKQHYAPIPDAVADAFAKSKVRRVVVAVGDHQMKRAINGFKNGGRFILLGADVLKQFHVRFGDEFTMTLWEDPDPEDLEICEEFQATLDLDEEAATRFNDFTLGRRRSLVHYINSAKSTETRIKRSLELAEKIRNYMLYDDIEDRKKAKKVVEQPETSIVKAVKKVVRKDPKK